VNVLDPAFRQQLEHVKDHPVNVIVIVTLPLERARSALEARGVHVQRTLRLIHGVAVSAPAHVILALTQEPWVQRIEPDRPVHTQRS